MAAELPAWRALARHGQDPCGLRQFGSQLVGEGPSDYPSDDASDDASDDLAQTTVRFGGQVAPWMMSGWGAA